ncbi:MAG: hypothetical protein GOP50_05590 [Candidatus Heimdallarchaeota archaeon]|nr:hypothetical protein [Candidatus Heimdallarchaeota archaeon]
MSFLSTKKLFTIVLISFLTIQATTVQSFNLNNNIKYDYFFEVVKFDVTASSDRFEGYNLFVVERHDGVTWAAFNRTLVIADLDGNIYFTKELYTEGALADYATEFVNSTTILYGDEDGSYLWNLETDITQYLNFSGHHDYERNYANDTYFALQGEIVKEEYNSYLFDRIIEYDSTGAEIWHVNTSNFVDFTQWCPYEDMSGSHRDLTHSNTVFYDEKEDVIYLNSRNLNTFYKIDHKTGDVIWALGEYGNFTLFDISGNEKDILFFHTHALEKIDYNKFIMFDNDEHNQTNITNFQSRLLEITIDEDKMYANVSWEWISPREYYSGIWGDCDLLPNGNFLGVFGVTGHPNTEYGARLVEVNITGDIVWEYSFAKAGSDVFGVYRIERFRFAPIVSTPTFHNLGVNDSYLEWDVWYNFRSKTFFEGEFYISKDDELVESGAIEFPRYWQNTTVRYNISETELGEHEVSLVVSDEAGHLSNDTDRYSSTGSISYRTLRKTGLVIGLSVGLGVSILAGVIVLVWFKFVKKKSIFKRK